MEKNIITNRQKLNEMTDEEFSTYIYSVYVAGKLEFNQNLKGIYSDTVKYTDWLKMSSEDK